MAKKRASNDERNFREREAAVLSWLLERPDVAKAVDLAEEGRRPEAKTVLLAQIQAILAGDQQSGRHADDILPEPSSQPTAMVVDEPGNDTSVEVAEVTRAEEDVADAAVAAVAAVVNPLESQVAVEDARKRPRLANATIATRCVCLFVLGLPGCGKSTICKILCEVLGGIWLNYDEVVSKASSSKASRQVFIGRFREAILQALTNSPQDQSQRFLFIDKVNVSRKERVELMQELSRAHWRDRGGTILMIEHTHEADVFGYGPDGQMAKRFGEQHIALCLKRIEQRGAAHHILWPSPRLRGHIQAIAKASEPPLPLVELKHLDQGISIDVAHSPVDSAANVIEKMRQLQWLENGRTAEELKPKIEMAWQAYQRAESQWRAGADQGVNDGVAVAALESEQTTNVEEAAERERFRAQCRQIQIEDQARAEAAEKARAEQQVRAEVSAKLWAEERARAEAAEKVRAAEKARQIAADQAQIEKWNRAELAAKKLAEERAQTKKDGVLAAERARAEEAERLQQARAEEEAKARVEETAKLAAAEEKSNVEPQPCADGPKVGSEEEKQIEGSVTEVASTPSVAVPDTPAYWKVDLPQVSKVLSQRGILPSNLILVKRPFAVLLRLRGGAVAEQQTRLPPGRYETILHMLRQREGEEVEVKMTEIVIANARFACAKLALPETLPCASNVPHVVLGLGLNETESSAESVLLALAAEGSDATVQKEITVMKLPAPRPLKGKLLLEGETVDIENKRDWL